MRHALPALILSIAALTGLAGCVFLSPEEQLRLAKSEIATIHADQQRSAHAVAWEDAVAKGLAAQPGVSSASAAVRWEHVFASEIDSRGYRSTSITEQVDFHVVFSADPARIKAPAEADNALARAFSGAHLDVGGIRTPRLVAGEWLARGTLVAPRLTEPDPVKPAEGKCREERR